MILNRILHLLSVCRQSAVAYRTVKIRVSILVVERNPVILQAPLS